MNGHGVEVHHSQDGHRHTLITCSADSLCSAADLVTLYVLCSHCLVGSVLVPEYFLD